MKIKIIFLAILSTFIMTSCSLETKNYNDSFFAMDTYCKITVFDTNKNFDFIQKEIKNIENNLSRTIKMSEIYKHNNFGLKIISKDINGLISETDKISKKLNNTFDIRLGAVTELWDFKQKQEIPHKNDIIKALNNKNKFDFGGVGKGYASDIATSILKNNGAKSAIIALGGNISLIGEKPNKSSFLVGIKYPDKNIDDQIATLSLKDCFVVTSGSYERSFVKNNKTYHHIIDPKTGYPVDNELLSVTIINKNGTQADILSTALFVMGVEKALELKNSNIMNFDAVFITKDKKIIYTKGIEGKINLNQKYKEKGYELEKR